MTPDENGYATCVNCGENKLVIDEIGHYNFSLLPKATPRAFSPSCNKCQAAKRKAIKEGLIEPKDPSNVPASREWVIRELKANYKEMHRASDKIRCLETIAKLLTKDEATPLDDAAVVRSMMESLREKKRAARSNEPDPPDETLQ